MNTTEATIKTTTTIIKYGPHAGHILHGNIKLSKDKKGREIAHKWTAVCGLVGGRWIRCDLEEAQAEIALMEAGK